MHKGSDVIGKLPPALDPGAALFLDVDGTLLEIAARPDLVEVPAWLPGLVARCAEERGEALALISGRSLGQLDRLFQPWRGAAAGLHGAERRRADGSFAPACASEAIARLRPRLADLARTGTGLAIEDKGAALALHYRAVPEREAEILAFAERLSRAAAPGLRLIEGKMVVEFVPAEADKGTAISAFLAEPPFRGRRPVFVGDDATDEDGFAAVDRHAGISVRVGPSGVTAAKYRLASVTAVLAWLGGSGNV
jgi:trehalose 6-phosphate phosphatase